MRGPRLLLVGLAIGVGIAISRPAAAENVLRFTGKDGLAATMDPHAYASEDNKGATYQVYEALLDVDSNAAASCAGRAGRAAGRGLQPRGEAVVATSADAAGGDRFVSQRR